MNGSKAFSLFILLLALGLVFVAPFSVAAQGDQPASPTPQPLTIYTDYPSRVIGFGEVINVPLKLQGSLSQTVQLEVKDLPKGWTATFRGGSQIVDSVYVDGVNEASVDLRLEPPADIQAGKYVTTIVASGNKEEAEFPLSFTIKEKLPPRLSLTVDGIPTKRGTPSSSFLFNLNLVNEGGEDLQVALSSEPPQNFQISIQSGGQDVTEIQLASNETKNLTVKAEPLISLESGKYPIAVHAQAGEVKADLDLTAEVVGEGKLSITTPDDRLSGEAIAGKETPFKIVLYNEGTAPLLGIELTSSEPSGWSVTFDQAKIAEIPAGQKVEITTRVLPADKAVAGDYIVTINARPLDSKVESADFRITVKTSTLWGIVGIGLIAIAVGVVGIAVARFGRR